MSLLLEQSSGRSPFYLTHLLRILAKVLAGVGMVTVGKLKDKASSHIQAEGCPGRDEGARSGRCGGPRLGQSPVQRARSRPPARICNARAPPPTLLPAGCGLLLGGLSPRRGLGSVGLDKRTSPFTFEHQSLDLSNT